MGDRKFILNQIVNYTKIRIWIMNLSSIFPDEVPMNLEMALIPLKKFNTSRQVIAIKTID